MQFLRPYGHIAWHWASATRLHVVCFVSLALQVFPNKGVVLQHKVTVWTVLLGNRYRATVDVQVVVAKHFGSRHMEVTIYQNVAF